MVTFAVQHKAVHNEMTMICAKYQSLLIYTKANDYVVTSFIIACVRPGEVPSAGKTHLFQLLCPQLGSTCLPGCRKPGSR